MLTARAAAKFKDKVPQVRRVNDVDRWFVGDRDFGSMGGNVIRKDNNKLLGRSPSRRSTRRIPAAIRSSRASRRWTTWVSMPRSAITIRA